jgi:hypothetical protein
MDQTKIVECSAEKKRRVIDMSEQRMKEEVGPPAQIVTSFAVAISQAVVIEKVRKPTNNTVMAIRCERERERER